MPQTTEFIDLSDHDAFLASVPHEAFAALRRDDPVHWNPEPDGRGFWAVTRYEDIRTVHRSAADLLLGGRRAPRWRTSSPSTSRRASR